MRKKRTKKAEKLWTTNALAEWWASDPRTVKRALAGIPPTKTDGRVRYWTWEAVDDQLTEYICSRSRGDFSAELARYLAREE